MTTSIASHATTRSKTETPETLIVIKLPAERATRQRVCLRFGAAAMEAAGISKSGNQKPANSKRPKTRLGLPDLGHSRSAVLDSLRSSESKRGYRHATDEFIQWYCSEPRLSSFNKAVVIT
jgi:hypothetical protein